MEVPPGLVRQLVGASVERCAGHAVVAGDLRSGLACLNELAGLVELAASEVLLSPAGVEACCAPLADGVVDPFPLDVKLHLGEAVMTVKSADPIAVIESTA